MKNDGSQVFHVGEEEAGQTLPAFLRRRLPELSWNQARRLITGRRLQIHGNLCMDHGRRLQAGEVVKLLGQAQAAPPRDEDVRIRYVDAHVVVVEKPAGMTTLRHSEERDWPTRRKQHQPTLDEVVSRLLALRARKPASGGRASSRGKERDDVAPRSLPVRAVHRLDRETSGLMVFARTVPAERALVQQFRRHTIHRAYLAIAHGRVAARTIESQLVRDRGDGRRGSSKLPGVGKRAVTHVRPVESLDGYTVVACRLETGRTHQIRIHLSEQGHFVCGDRVYSQPLFQKPLVDHSGAPRLALHAAELGFVHPITGESLSFQQPLPSDLLVLLNKLRRAARLPEGATPTIPRDGWPVMSNDSGDEEDDDDLIAGSPPAEDRPSGRTSNRERNDVRPRGARRKPDAASDRPPREQVARDKATGGKPKATGGRAKSSERQQQGGRRQRSRRRRR